MWLVSKKWLFIFTFRGWWCSNKTTWKILKMKTNWVTRVNIFTFTKDINCSWITYRKYLEKRSFYSELLHYNKNKKIKSLKCCFQSGTTQKLEQSNFKAWLHTKALHPASSACLMTNIIAVVLLFVFVTMFKIHFYLPRGP